MSNSKKKRLQSFLNFKWNLLHCNENADFNKKKKSFKAETEQFPHPQELTPDDDHLGRNMF
jgi:hypothetical protein